MAEETIVPGMEHAQGGNGYASGPYNPYSSSSAGNAYDQNGTRVPGMESRYQTPGQPEKAATKPIVGFLYSVSRIPTGEYWPIYQGQNTIGRDGDSNICLPEASVSRKHATLLTRRKGNKVIAAVTDDSSTEGTMINGEQLGFKATECVSGDIITVGRNYELLVVLISAEELGLAPKTEFVDAHPTAGVGADNAMGGFPGFAGGQPEGTHNGGMPYGGGMPSFNPGMAGGFNPGTGNGGGAHINDGTVGMDGSSSSYNGGGTTA